MNNQKKKKKRERKGLPTLIQNTGKQSDLRVISPCQLCVLSEV